jgi:hypothetical protein
MSQSGFSINMGVTLFLIKLGRASTRGARVDRRVAPPAGGRGGGSAGSGALDRGAVVKSADWDAKAITSDKAPRIKSICVDYEILTHNATIRHMFNDGNRLFTQCQIGTSDRVLTTLTFRAIDTFSFSAVRAIQTLCTPARSRRYDENRNQR